MLVLAVLTLPLAGGLWWGRMSSAGRRLPMSIHPFPATLAAVGEDHRALI